MRTRAERRAINTKALADDTVAMLLELRARQLRIEMDDEAKTIELWPCGYDAPCRVRNYRAKATTIARSIDAGGRPIRQYELCQAHAGQVAERERAKNLLVNNLP